ncbi:hypothetical protein GCM10010277_74650 [Streptomyces longisporoflavus]|nr:hypothetical protein GCM10010277_74650 [Streptomyces longisporoflavus]
MPGAACCRLSAVSIAPTPFAVSLALTDSAVVPSWHTRGAMATLYWLRARHRWRIDIKEAMEAQVDDLSRELGHTGTRRGTRH